MTRSRDVASNGGLVLITSNTFTTQSSVSINNCFSSTYQNYSIILSVNTPSADNFFRFRLRANGTDSTASYFMNQVLLGNYNAAGVYQDNNASSMGLFDCDAANSGSFYGSNITVINPFNSVATTFNLSSNGVSQDGAYTRSYVGGAQHRVTTSYDGFTIFPDAGTVSGTLRVYGIRN